MDIKKAMKMWNCGFTKEEAMAKYGFDVSSFFDEFERKIGHRCFTISEISSGKIGKRHLEQQLSESYKEWKGISGPGKQLREIIKENNNEQ